MCIRFHGVLLVQIQKGNGNEVLMALMGCLHGMHDGRRSGG